MGYQVGGLCISLDYSWMEVWGMRGLRDEWSRPYSRPDQAIQLSVFPSRSGVEIQCRVNVGSLQDSGGTGVRSRCAGNLNNQG